MKKLFFIVLMSWFVIAKAQEFIDGGGAYVVSGELAVDGNGAHVLSGGFNYLGDGEARVNVFLLAYSSSNSDLQALMNDSSTRLIDVADLGITESGVHSFGMDIDFSASNATKAVLILEAVLPEGALLSIENIRLVPLEESAASGENSSSGNLSGDGKDNASSSNANGGAGGANSNLGATASSSESGGVKISPMQFSSLSGVIVYVNSASGNDANSGESSTLAKQTIASALAISGVSQINLAGGSTPYIAPIIRPASGTTVVIKPEGTVIIKGQ